MKLSNETIPPLAETITGDNEISFYRSGPELVSFFNDLGFNDKYGQGFPSRWVYTENKIRELNNSDKLNKLFKKLLDPRKYIDKEFEIKKITDFLNQYLKYDGYELVKHNDFYKVKKIENVDGVKDDFKNLIFAADGPKPEIVIDDSISNNIKIVKNKKYCLIYNKEIPIEGLKWKDLTSWWKEKEDADNIDKSLYNRLKNSLDSKPEKLFFHTYYKHYFNNLKEKLPALIPQVYLHYDPYTQKQLNNIKRLPRQRMDFLILLSDQTRIVIEIDGKHHYSEGEKSSPERYAKMVSADRDLRLKGYEVYRFGGYEFINEEKIREEIIKFFRNLFSKYNILD